MIVADANVVAYLFIEGDQTALAQAVLRGDPAWRLPPLWRHEVLKVLATFVRSGGASWEEVPGRAVSMQAFCATLPA